MHLRALALVTIAAVGSAVAPFSGSAQPKPIFKLLSLDQHQVRWFPARQGQPLIVTYSYVRAAIENAGARNCGRMVPLDGMLASSGLAETAVRDEIARAFRMWEAAADIRFVETSDWRKAGILIGAQADPEGFAYANVARTTVKNEPRAIERSLVCFNPAKRWKIGYDGDLNVLDIRFTAAHEIGHAIGLDHPSRVGQLMSYRYEELFREPQAGDLAGAAALYGPPRSAPVAPDTDRHGSYLAINQDEQAPSSAP